MTNPKRILVVKLSAIGDVLIASPVAKALRTAYPDSYIAWVVEHKAADVILGNPYLDEIFIWKRVKTKNHFNDFFSNTSEFQIITKQLREKKFDIAIDTQGRLRSAMITYASGAPCRVGFSDLTEGAANFYNKKYTQPAGVINAQQRNLNLLKTIGIETDDLQMHMPMSNEDRAFANEFFAQNKIESRRVFAFIPATTWMHKHWTIDGWARLVQIVADKYNAVPLFFGSKADLDLVGKIINKANTKVVVATGNTTLKQAGALLEKCDLAIAVDTGLMHMAMALNVPTVGLFGPTIWQHFLKKENIIYVVKDFPCVPCMRHPTCQDVDCMVAIKPEDVDEAIGRLI